MLQIKTLQNQIKKYKKKTCLFCWKLNQHCKCHMATFPSFIGGERSQVTICALFQAQVCTWIEPPMFHKQTGWLFQMKETKVPGRIWTNSNEGKMIVNLTSQTWKSLPITFTCRCTSYISKLTVCAGTT